MMNQDLTCATTLAELERATYANGDTERAAMLARLADDADELRRLREMYWVLRDCFPIASGDKNADILEKIKAIQETIEDAGDISEPD